MPPEFLAKAERGERAHRIAYPVLERLRKKMEKDVAILLEAGVPEQEILARISNKYTRTQ